MHSHFLEKPPFEQLQILSSCQSMPVCLPIFLFSMTTGITLQSSVCSQVLNSIPRSLYFSILSYSLLSTLPSPGHVTSTILHTFLPLCTCNDNMQEVMLQMTLFICLHSDVPQDFQIFIFCDNYYHYYHCHFVIFWNI